MISRFHADDETSDGKIPMITLIDILTHWGTKQKRLKREEAVELIDLVSSGKQGDVFDYNQFLSVYNI